MYLSPYTKEETHDLIDQVSVLRKALALCWSLLPDGDYGLAGASVKQYMTRFTCWPDAENTAADKRKGN